MVLEKSISFDVVKKTTVEEKIGIVEMEYLGKYGVDSNGRNTADLQAALHVGDKAVISIVVENFTEYNVSVSLKLYDNGVLVPMAERYADFDVMYQSPPKKRYASVPCTSIGKHVITARIALK